MLGSGRGQWRDALGGLARPEEDRRPVEAMEELDATSLSARIGVKPVAAPEPSPPTPPLADGSARWRRALRTS